MADVFLSYAREDAARAEQIAGALTQAGLDVFWDNEIPAGATWADYIEQKLSQCKALIVIWSEHSTKSQWVREEARMGRDKGVLIPVMIDASQPPFGFGEVQSANLVDWNGETDSPQWRRFADAVARFTQTTPTPQPTPAPQPAPATQPQAWSAPSATAATPAGGGSVPTWVWIAGGVGALAVIGFVIVNAMNPAGTAPSQPPTTTVAQQQPAIDYRQQILDRLSQIEDIAVSQGFQRLSDPVSGQLNQGQQIDTPLTLNAGGQYRIIGVCDSDCGDMDLVLFDQNGNAVSEDTLPDPAPIVEVVPQWSGPFTVRAYMHACSVQPCYYALVLYGRPTQ